MIGKTENGVALMYELSDDYAETLGDFRMEMIDRVLYFCLVANLQSSYIAAITGALRHPY